MLARCTASLLAVLASLLLGLAALATPPLLGRFVLAAGPLPGRRSQFLAWIAALMLLAAAFLCARFSMGVWRRRGSRAVHRGLLVALTTFLAGGLALEMVARTLLIDPLQKYERLLPEDAWWRARFVMAQPPELRVHRLDARLGWEPQPGHRSEGITINALGARSAELPVERPAGERRIVVVGDSFTFGEGVHDGETWIARMERDLAVALSSREPGASVRTLNFGVMGYGLDQQVLRLEERALDHGPDLVLLALFGPDLDRNELSFRDYAKPRFELVERGGALDRGDGVADGLRLVLPDPAHADPPRGVLLEQLGEHLELPLPRSAALGLLRRAIDDLYDTTVYSPKWEVARRLLDRALASTRARGSRFAMAYFPTKANSFDALPDAHERCVVAWAAANGVELVNVRPVFRALGSKRFHEVWSGHWTVFGNDVVGAAIAEQLLARGLLER